MLDVKNILLSNTAADCPRKVAPRPASLDGLELHDEYDSGQQSYSGIPRGIPAAVVVVDNAAGFRLSEPMFAANSIELHTVLSAVDAFRRNE